MEDKKKLVEAVWPAPSNSPTLLAKNVVSDTLKRLLENVDLAESEKEEEKRVLKNKILELDGAITDLVKKLFDHSESADKAIEETETKFQDLVKMVEKVMEGHNAAYDSIIEHLHTGITSINKKRLGWQVKRDNPKAQKEKAANWFVPP